MNGIVFDTGALIALDRNNRKVWGHLHRALERGEVPAVPTVVVAQAWRGGARQALLARALDVCHSEPLDDELARRAGALCGRSATSDIVDAVVVESAARHQLLILTSDSEDLEYLAGHVTDDVTVISVSGAG